jgi:hypothetical protein
VPASNTCVYGAAACTNCGAVFLQQLLRPIKYYFIHWMECVLETHGCRVAAVIIIICVPSGSAAPIGTALIANALCLVVRRLSTLRAEHIKVVINCTKNATFLLHVGHLSTKSLLY